MYKLYFISKEFYKNCLSHPPFSTKSPFFHTATFFNQTTTFLLNKWFNIDVIILNLKTTDYEKNRNIKI